jgi:hypothetical protein
MKTEAQLRSSRNYIARHPERVRESARLSSRRYRQNHPEEARAKGRRWYARNRVNRLASLKKWKDSHREERLLHARGQRTRRRELIAKYKDVPCTDCGQKFPPCAMDFNHVNGDKKFSIANKSMTGIEQIRKEMEKCEVVCANCHRVRTWKRANGKS